MPRDGAPRAALLVAVGVVGFVIGVYSGLGASVALWGFEDSEAIAFVTPAIGFGTIVSTVGVIIASGRPRAVWRMVASRAALVAGLAIVAILTWNLDAAWLLPSGVAIVGIEIWSSHIAAEQRGFPSPVMADR